MIIKIQRSYQYNNKITNDRNDDNHYKIIVLSMIK